ncbi:MAG: hypothetical protein K0Q87_162 [Neobacillus sp.]|jgi:hypothetical protein|nr:hypothetical protein [Neobacillus sp.]
MAARRQELTFEVTAEQLHDIERKKSFRWRDSRNEHLGKNVGRAGRVVKNHMPVVFYCPSIQAMRCYKVTSYIPGVTDTLLYLI